MRHVVALSAAVAVAIIGAWWWLGLPVEMPPAPLEPGEKLYCVSYAPFRGQQSPLDRSTRIDPSQIEEDLTRLAPLTDCVRTYSNELGLDRVAEIAERHGLKVIQGVWLGREPARNRLEIGTAVDTARRYPNTVRAIVAGNEVLLRGELSGSDLAGLIRDIKARVSVPVTYAEVWEFWLRNREVADAVDFVTIHILPYWEDIPIPAAEAAAHVGSIRRALADAFPGKDILLGEVGWPSAGRMREGALPSPVNQARVLHDVLWLAKRDRFHANLIEAFDQPWKRALEGTVGGHWGLLDGDRRGPKFSWGVALSNHPHWIWHAALGIVLAAAVFGGAARSRRVDRPPTAMEWLGVAAIALIPGILLGWAIENVPTESLGLGGWFHSLALAAVAIVAPVTGAAALMHKVPVPAFSRVLGEAEDRPSDWLLLALGWSRIVLCVLSVEIGLGLIFDPRYRDFPFAPLTAAGVPFLVLVLIGPRPSARLGLAETVTAIALGGSAIYIAIHEGTANWQALWLAAVLASLSLALLRSRDAPG